MSEIEEEIETFPIDETLLDEFSLLSLSNAETNPNCQEIVDSFSGMYSIEEKKSED